jgi:hypothetical protein
METYEVKKGSNNGAEHDPILKLGENRNVSLFEEKVYILAWYFYRGR